MPLAVNHPSVARVATAVVARMASFIVSSELLLRTTGCRCSARKTVTEDLDRLIIAARAPFDSQARSS